MIQRHIVLVSFAVGLLVCSCGRDREAAAEKRIAMSGGNAITHGETQLSMTPVIIDTRSQEEYADGHLEGALLMPYNTIGSMIAARVPDKNAPVLLYCRSGNRAGMALKTLVSMNYTRVENLGGIRDAADKLKREVVK